MRYPVVLFDVGETLVGPRESYGEVYRRVLSELGHELDVERLDLGIRDVAARLAREIPPGRDRFGHFPGGETEFWSRFVHSVYRRVTGEEPGPDFARAALGRLRDAFAQRSAWVVYDDVIPVLDELLTAGARLGIVSNWDSRLPGLLDLLDLSSYFEVVGVSHLEGVEKPDPALFHRVLEKLNCEPRQALHVGNTEEYDVAGARAAGVDAVLLDRQGQASPGAGVVAIDSLSAMPRLARGDIPL